MERLEQFAPETLDEVAALLLAADGRTRPRVRGTDLIAEVREEGGTTSLVIDLARVPDLNRLEYDDRNGLCIGAAVPFEGVFAFPPVQRLYPILADGPGAPGWLGSAEPATLGGTLGNAPPAADVLLPLICLRASAAVFGPHGWSELGVEALCAGPGGPSLQHGEFLVDVHLPAPLARSGGAYLRAAGSDVPAPCGVGVFLVMEEDLATCCGARVGLWTPARALWRALETERFLGGQRLTEAVLREAGDLVAQHAVLPSAGGRGEGGAGRATIGMLAERTLRLALDRVRGVAAS